MCLCGSDDFLLLLQIQRVALTRGAEWPRINWPFTCTYVCMYIHANGISRSRTGHWHSDALAVCPSHVLSCPVSSRLLSSPLLFSRLLLSRSLRTLRTNAKARQADSRIHYDRPSSRAPQILIKALHRPRTTQARPPLYAENLSHGRSRTLARPPNA